MMCGPEVCHKRAAVLAWRIAESQQRRGPAIHDDQAFEARADLRECVDTRDAALERAGPAGNDDVMTGNRAAQAGPWWFTDLSGFGQCAVGGIRGEHGTRERMT